MAISTTSKASLHAGSKPFSLRQEYIHKDGKGQLDNQPAIWLVWGMDDIGIFEAKTKFPGLCDQVVRSGSPVLIRRRGKPLVIVSPAHPISSENIGIFDQWKKWQTTHPDDSESDFPEVWKLRQDKTESPLDQ